MQVEDAVRNDDMPVTDKARKVLSALRDMCVEHGVCLSVSGYDGIEVWDLSGDGSNEVIHCAGITDCTRT